MNEAMNEMEMDDNVNNMNMNMNININSNENENENDINEFGSLKLEEDENENGIINEEMSNINIIEEEMNEFSITMTKSQNDRNLIDPRSIEDNIINTAKLELQRSIEHSHTKNDIIEITPSPEPSSINLKTDADDSNIISSFVFVCCL